MDKLGNNTIMKVILVIKSLQHLTLEVKFLPFSEVNTKSNQIHINKIFVTT